LAIVELELEDVADKLEEVRNARSEERLLKVGRPFDEPKMLFREDRTVNPLKSLWLPTKENFSLFESLAYPDRNVPLARKWS
jgi:hypothetical protein